MMISRLRDEAFVIRW